MVELEHSEREGDMEPCDNATEPHDWALDQNHRVRNW